MKNLYGSNLNLKIYGGSHDERIGMVLSGIPAGEVIDMEALYALMARRAPGKDPYSTSRREADEPVFLSGLDGNITNGEPIEAVIYNKNPTIFSTTGADEIRETSNYRRRSR